MWVRNMKHFIFVILTTTLFAGSCVGDENSPYPPIDIVVPSEGIISERTINAFQNTTCVHDHTDKDSNVIVVDFLEIDEEVYASITLIQPLSDHLISNYIVAAPSVSEDTLSVLKNGTYIYVSSWGRFFESADPIVLAEGLCESYNSYFEKILQEIASPQG